MDTTRGFRKSVGLLWTKRFGTFWVASLLSNLGTWAQQVAEPWLLLTLGASPLVIGLDAFAMNGPAWALTLFGGVLADRMDRRRVILLFQSIQMLCPALLVVLLLVGLIHPWHVVALSLVVGVTDGLSMPSFQSIVPSIVGPSGLGSAYALNSTQFNLARIIGPAIAGVLMVTVGAVGCFTLNTASYLPFILVALWILPPQQGRISPVDSSRSHRLFAGFGELMCRRDVRGALATVFVSGTLCVPLVTFCPVLIKDVLHQGAGHFGGALTAYGIGGLLGAVGLLSAEGRVDRRILCSGFAAAWGTIVAAASLNHSFPLLTVLMALAGLSMTMSNISANTLLQALADERHRGQTASLFMLALRGGLSVGNLATGTAVGLVGVQRALMVDAVLAVMVQLALARWWLRA